MKKWILRAGLLVITLLSVVACRYGIEDDLQEATLNLAENRVLFAKGDTEKSVFIDSNLGRWNAFSSEEGIWLTLQAESNSLKISVAPNTKPEERKATVLISAGAVIKSLEVIQSGADVMISTDPQSVEIPASGGSQSIDIACNSSWNATLEGGDGWLKMSLHPEFGKIELTAETNKSIVARDAHIKLESGKEVHFLTIKQLGMKSFMLPMPAHDETSLAKLIRFEIARGSVLSGQDNGRPVMGLPASIAFATQSLIMPSLTYTYFKGTGTYLSASGSGGGKEAVEAVKSPAFLDFLSRNHFEEVTNSTSGGKEYVNEDFRMIVKIENDQKVFFEFYLYSKQTKQYPTLAKLNMEPIDALLLKDAPQHVADVAKWEKANGGTLIESWTDKNAKGDIIQQLYEVKNHPNHTKYRLYKYKDRAKKTNIAPNEVETVDWIYEVVDNLELVFRPGARRGEYVVTNEFRELCTSEGFKMMTRQGGVGFMRESDLLLAYPQVMDLKMGDNNVEHVAVIMWFKHPNMAGNNISAIPEEASGLLRRSVIKK